MTLQRHSQPFQAKRGADSSHNRVRTLSAHAAHRGPSSPPSALVAAASCSARSCPSPPQERAQGQSPPAAARDRTAAFPSTRSTQPRARTAPHTPTPGCGAPRPAAPPAGSPRAPPPAGETKSRSPAPLPARRRRCLPAAGPPAASAPAAAGSAAAFPLSGTWRRGGAAAGRPPAVLERGWSPERGEGCGGSGGRVGRRRLPGLRSVPACPSRCRGAGCRLPL